MPESSLIVLSSLPWRATCHIRLGINGKKREAIWDHISVHPVSPGSPDDAHVVPTGTVYPGSLRRSSAPEI